MTFSDSDDHETSDSEDSVGSLKDFIVDDENEGDDENLSDTDSDNSQVPDTMSEITDINEEVADLQQAAEDLGAPDQASVHDDNGCRRSTRKRKRPQLYQEECWTEEEHQLVFEDVDEDALSETDDEILGSEADEDEDYCVCVDASGDDMDDDENVDTDAELKSQETA